jgi:excisionase family DNA binding protein
MKDLGPHLRKARHEEERIMTVEELASYLQVDSSRMYKQTSLGTIPYLKSGKYLRFRKKDIDKWMESRTRRPIPPMRVGNS